jgi:hypothetical protein
MPKLVLAAEKALGDLQGLVRRPPDGRERVLMTRRLPDDLATDEDKFIGVLADEVKAAEKATAVLVDDLRFEHLDHADDAVWRFAAECWADRLTDHVPAFVARHAAEVMPTICYLPVEFLTVSGPAGGPPAGGTRRRARAAGRLADGSWIEGFPGGSQTLTDACLRAGFRPRIDFTAREWIAKQGFVAAGLGLALIPLLAAGTVRPGIALRPLHPDDAPVHAATRRGAAMPPPVPAFLHHLAVTARQRPAGPGGGQCPPARKQCSAAASTRRR